MTKRGITFSPVPEMIKRGPGPDGPPKKNGLNSVSTDFVNEQLLFRLCEPVSVSHCTAEELLVLVQKMVDSLKRRFTQEKAATYSQKCESVFNELVQTQALSSLPQFTALCEELLLIMARKGSYDFSCERVQGVVRCLHVIKTQGLSGLRRHWKRIERLEQDRRWSDC